MTGMHAMEAIGLNDVALHPTLDDSPSLLPPLSAWYVIHTKPRAEEKAASFLGQRAITTFLPRLLVHRRHGSRRRQTLEPLFPGYLFARCQPEPEWIDRIRWTPGVRRVLGNEEAPTPVPEEVVTFLQDREGGRGFIEAGSRFSPGIRVRFTGGPLVHLEGIIERPTSRADRVRILLELLDRQVSVEVDTAALEPL
jgi:transcriptional antiterminator RfaH